MTTPTLDLSYLHARPVVPRAWTRLTLALVGCGGTGSWLAPSLARLTRVLLDAGKSVRLFFIDPDTVEPANVPRQNFCAAELGAPKAAALALRYGAAWGLEIDVVVGRLTPAQFSVGYEEALLIAGCVDNAAGRQTIAGLLRDEDARRDVVGARADGRTAQPPRVWWLDCGNARDTGQVLLGSGMTPGALTDTFSLPSICRALPAPALQHPELLEALPEELAETRLSCAELALRNAQGLIVNQAVAAVAANYVHGFLFGGLRTFASYLDLATNTTKSYYTTPEALARWGVAAPKPPRAPRKRAARRAEAA
jgi:PRTRC genetic system ThiF family protein